MSKELLSPFRLVDVQIIGLNYEVDLDLVEKPISSERPIQIEASFSEYGGQDTTENAALELMLNIKTAINPERQNKRKKVSPIASIDVQARGIVSCLFKEGTPEDEKELMLRANGVSLLYGEMRGHVSTVTSLSPIGRIELPGINPLAIAMDSLEKDALT